MSSNEEASTASTSGGTEAGIVRDVGSKIFLGGLSWEVSEEKMKEHFEAYGEILEVVVMRDRNSGRPRGFGFVTYKDPGAADIVVQEKHVIDGREIDVKKSVPQESKAKARKIFVGGLAPETSEDDLEKYFSQYGQVVETQIMLDHLSGRSRGFGFVTFEEDKSAFSVFLEGMMHVIRGKRVEVKPATPKGSGSMKNNRTERSRKSDEFLQSNMMSSMMHSMLGQSYPYGMYSYPGGGSQDVMMPTPYPNVQYPNMMPYMMVSPQGYPSSTFNSPYVPQFSPQVMSPTASMDMQAGKPGSMDTYFTQTGNHSTWSQPPPRGREGSKPDNRKPAGSRNRDSATSLDQHVEFTRLNLGE
eukprot:jgi/Picsp_1/2043/NSC_05508-R1_heterogeneous nuclearribonucleoprotein a2